MTDETYGARTTESISPGVADRVEQIVGAAERAAENFRRESELQASQRAAELREGAELEAMRMRRDAEAEAAAYLIETRRRIDAFASDRIGAITTLTEQLIEQADSVARRFDAAEQARRQVYDLITALGEAAETVANEAARSQPSVPPYPTASSPAAATTADDGGPA